MDSHELINLSTLGQFLTHPLCDNPGMKLNKRHQISRKAEILGTRRRLLLLAVRRLKEEEDWRYSQEELPWDSPLNAAYSVPALSVRHAIPLNEAQLPPEDALRVKSAEFWLKLGELKSWLGARNPDGGNGGGEERGKAMVQEKLTL
jgi:hypothetical protein